MALITPTEVSSIAFVNSLDPALILPEFIASASTKFVVPLVTQSVLDSIDITPGDYTTLVDDFIKPYLAFAVKYMFYNQLLTETQQFPTSDDQRIAAIQEILTILEIKRDLLKTYLNDNIFETPVTETKPSVAGIFLSSSIPTAASSDPNTDVASTLNAASVATLADADTLNFIQFTTGLLRKISWSNVKSTLKSIFDQLYAPVDHDHGDTISAVTDGIFNLDATDGILTVTPFPAKPVPSPDYAYFRNWDGFIPTSPKPLVLEGMLSASKFTGYNASYPPVEAISSGYSNPAAKFNGGVVCQANNGVPVLLVQHFVSGTGGVEAILLQITRNISGTLSHNKPVININDDPESPNVTGELLKATVDSILRVNLNPRVPDGSSAVAYMLDTRNSLVNASALLLSIRNQGIEKLSLSASGALSVTSLTVNGQAGVSGSFTSADGKTITVTNGIISSII
jgi:hypothetical protein